jgi:hypothetical protein
MGETLFLTPFYDPNCNWRSVCAVHVPAKAVSFAQNAQCFYHYFAGVAGAAADYGAQEQPFDIIAPVKGHCQFRQLSRRKGDAGRIV